MIGLLDLIGIARFGGGRGHVLSLHPQLNLQCRPLHAPYRRQGPAVGLFDARLLDIAQADGEGGGRHGCVPRHGGEELPPVGVGHIRPIYTDGQKGTHTLALNVRGRLPAVKRGGVLWEALLTHPWSHRGRLAGK